MQTLTHWATAIQEMELLHFSAINEAYHKGILRSWDAGGCYEEISNRMGYRLSLTSADFNEQVRPGGILNLTVNLQNTGFASIINERPLYVVLVGQDAILPHKAKLELDPRTWQPGTSAFNVQLHIPSNADEGDYQLVLWLPDGYESLQDNPLYAIRFANENVWDEFAGYNILGMVNINNDAGGSYQRGKKFEVIESTSAVERGAASVLPVRPTAVFSSTELISNPHIKTEADNLSISFKFVGDPASYNGFQVLLDTDQDTTTGMPIENMGADFLLENDTLNAYSGSGSDWTWAPVEGELTFTNDKQTAQWTLPRSTLGNSSKMDVVFQLVDSNWNTAFVTPKITYILK